MTKMVKMLEVLKNENDEVRKVLSNMDALYLDVINGGNANEKIKLGAVLDQLEALNDHYTKKETYLFPYLMQHDLVAMTRKMWEQDDLIRVLLGYLKKLIAVEENLELERVYEELVGKIKSMIEDEETVLFPLAQKVLTNEEWSNMYDESRDQEPVTQEINTHNENYLEVLPFELVVTDADGKVVKYSRGSDPAFNRSQAMVGAKWYNVYPPQQAKDLAGLLGQFQRGEKEQEDFWVKVKDRLVLMHYYTLKDEKGHFNGVVEMIQNVAPIQGLKGQKMLLTRV